ncbi:stage II sporulation protein P [Paenibacillus sp. UNC451MF]|uniref:stage II sporulation protein P n=1 Tax=Paenibacillus sp. UNC451MF TaxID=1449063 RepID=UPI0006898D89|nr:stage II sporulation protein P [Paenibacillus sp. UNC451MF]
MLRYKVICAAVGSFLLIGTLNAPDVFGQEASQGTTGNQSMDKVQVKLRDVGTEKKFAKSTVDRLNVRTKPDLNASIIQMIGQSNRYEILEERGDWIQIRLSEEKVGWVFHEYFEYAASEPANAEPEKAKAIQTEEDTAESLNQATVVNIVDVTNLRSGPGTEYGITGKAKPGETYPVLETKGEWYVVSLPDKKTAYVASWVVKTDFIKQNTHLPPAAAVGSAPILYIYHTHNQESWNHVASMTKGASVDDPEVNITLVGERLEQLLQEKGIPALAGNENITEKLKQQKLGYSLAYEVSRKVVDKAIENYPTLSYFFDIHRDADVPREKTTITIEGKSYARILFVIGTAHSGYEENKAFAEKLDKLLNERYPGLSRGILIKSAHQGNGEYNQSVSPGSLLLEIGGVNNTLQESLLAADALADVFADYYGAGK